MQPSPDNTPAPERGKTEIDKLAEEISLNVSLRNLDSLSNDSVDYYARAKNLAARIGVPHAISKPSALSEDHALWLDSAISRCRQWIAAAEPQGLTKQTIQVVPRTVFIADRALVKVAALIQLRTSDGSSVALFDNQLELMSRGAECALMLSNTAVSTRFAGTCDVIFGKKAATNIFDSITGGAPLVPNQRPPHRGYGDYVIRQSIAHTTGAPYEQIRELNLDRIDRLGQNSPLTPLGNTRHFRVLSERGELYVGLVYDDAGRIRHLFAAN